jgi:hypothetical protein
VNIIEDPRPPGEVEREYYLLKIIQQVWTYAVTTKSDTARTFADEIAEGLSRGYLTTRVTFGEEVFGRLLKVTASGLTFLEEKAPNRIAKEEVANYEAICNGVLAQA